MMNMFISILNDVLVEVHADVKLQDNDYEMVDYMVNSMRSKPLLIALFLFRNLCGWTGAVKCFHFARIKLSRTVKIHKVT